jgi:hypothetical protein
MAAIHVDLTGLKAAACKYFTIRRIPVCSWRTFAHWRVLGSAGIEVGVGVMGNFHNPVQWSLGPVKTMSSFLVMTTVVRSKVALQPASHSVPMDTSELCVRPGIKCVSHTSYGSWGMFKVQLVLLDWRVVPFGRPTVILSCVVPFDLWGRVVVYSVRWLLYRLWPWEG